jgi:hypothetical protein
MLSIATAAQAYPNLGGSAFHKNLAESFCFAKGKNRRDFYYFTRIARRPASEVDPENQLLVELRAAEDLGAGALGAVGAGSGGAGGVARAVCNGAWEV